MKKVFDDSSWIWYCAEAKKDSYGDFTDRFNYTGGTVTLRISCDGDYTLFVNGKYASSNQYADFEHYKSYDELDITDYLSLGENTLSFLVWHLGIGCFKYSPAQAGLLYEVVCEGEVLAKSSTDTLSRENPNYKSGYGKLITSQLGQSFLYDASLPDDVPFKKSVAVDKKCNMVPRPIKKAELLAKKEISVLKNDGNHYLIDLGEETVGFPTLRFTSSSEQKILVAWGEHIADGCVRRKIGSRDFSFEYVAKKGVNDYTNYMLRLGCRYLEVFCEENIDLDFISIIPLVYPVEILPKKFENELDQKIYDLCTRTLKLCMMDRYVDTPWREQAFYAYDSRNQMLCGYHALENGNRDYARAALVLTSKGLRDDGLLSITYPNGDDLPIPSFSLHYITSVKEYLEHIGDTSLAEEVYPVLRSIIDTVKAQIKNGLVYSFSDPKYWNFYDWSPYMEGYGEGVFGVPDLMINCLFIIALENFKIISEKLGRPFEYQDTVDTVRVNAKREFFSSEDCLFSMKKGEKQYTEIGNSAAVLAGLTSKEERLFIAQKLAENELCSCSLSTKCFKYNAMLAADEKFRANVLKAIRDGYKIMIDAGATSVWEVLEGEKAFSNAGSLCHAWSAIPVLYL